MSLPERPGLLHAVPAFNLMLLLWLLFFLGSSLMRQSGMAIELPPSRFQLERYPETYVVTLGMGEGQAQIHLGRDAVTLEELSSRFDVLRKQGAPSRSMVLLHTDVNTPIGVERQVAEMLLAKGFRLAVVGASEPAVNSKPLHGEP
jgi:biopolymer transport protein ExbD